MEDTEEQIKQEKKRGFVLKELISTEVTYVDRLKFLVEVVVKPLRESNLLDSNDKADQFNTLEKIYALHSQISFTILETNPEKFGELFQHICDNVQLYSDYLVNYEDAMAKRCSLLVSNRKFSDFLDKAEKDPRLQNQKIESIFILPVQRIPRYRLLLEQLLKYTSTTHTEYNIVNLVLEKICNMAIYSNEAIRKRENRCKIMDIIKTIEPTSRVDLLANPDRLFIKEGPLLRQCRRGLKEFQFWLFNDQLLYGQPTPLGLYILNRQIPLSKCHVKSCESMHIGGYAFIVESPAKSFIICLPSEAEKNEWLDAIQNTIIQLSQQHHTATSSSGSGVIADSIAPLWIPDSNTSSCQKCHSNFSLILRRHHCRNCGAIVCDNCSKKRYKLEHVNQKHLVRVCDPCYLFLSSEGSKSIRLNSLKKNKKYLSRDIGNYCGGRDNKNEFEEDEGSDLHISDDEMEADLYDRDHLEEDDLYDFNDAMKDETSKKCLHEQVFATNSSTTFHPEPSLTTSTIFNKMGKSLTEVLSLGNPAMNRLRGTIGGSSYDSESTSTISTPITSPYTGINNSSNTTTGADGTTAGSPMPPAKPPRTPGSASSPTPTSPAPRMGGLLRSVSAFVTSSASSLRGNVSSSSPPPSSTAIEAPETGKEQGRFSLDASSPAASAVVREEISSVSIENPCSTTTASSSHHTDTSITTYATTCAATTLHPLSPSTDSNNINADSPTPPVKPPKPHRRTNVCIAIDPQLLEQHHQDERKQQKEEGGEGDGDS